MYQSPEQLFAFSKANLETVINFASITLQGTERLLDLQLKAAKEALAQSMKNAKAMSEVKDVQQALALQAAVSQPGLEQAMDYSRSVYEVTSATQAEIAKLVEARCADINQSIAAAVDKAARSAPAGSDMAIAAVRSAMAAATSAYDTMSKSAKQVRDITESSVNATSARMIANGKKRA
jgi:phasin family protein